MPVAMRIAGLLVLTAAISAWGQASDDKKDDKKAAKPAPTRWTILFRSADPSVWDTDAKDAKGKQVAIPLKFAPEEFRYLRLRRMDTGEAQIVRIAPNQLRNGKPTTSPEEDFWWNGANEEGWKGRHLGI